MKSLAIALLLGAAGLAHAQAAGSPPAATPQLDPLFQAPQLQAPGKPQFKWQDPDGSHRFFIPQMPAVQIPLKPSIQSDIDPGFLRKPRGFAQPPSRPAPQSHLYPGLKIQPVEIAKLDGAVADLRPRAEPIPRIFPKAKVEPIPITWDRFGMVPIGAAPSSNP